MRSVLQKEKRCFKTGDISGLHEHHIFGGNGRRQLSEKYGLKIWLRYDWHDLAHHNREFANELKRIGQRAFERNHSRAEFMNLFGKNYLWDEDLPEKDIYGEECFQLTEPVYLPY